MLLQSGAQVRQQLFHLLELRLQLGDVRRLHQHLLQSLHLTRPKHTHLLQQLRELDAARVALQVVVRRGHQEQQLVVAVVLQQQLVEQVDRRLAAVSLPITAPPTAHAAIVVVQLQQHLPRKETHVVGGQHVVGGVCSSVAQPTPTHSGDDGVHLHQQVLRVVEAALGHAAAGQQHEALHAVWADGEAVRDAALAVLLRIGLLSGVKDMPWRGARISQVGHVELADGAVGAAETVEEHLLVIALGHCA